MLLPLRWRFSRASKRIIHHKLVECYNPAMSGRKREYYPSYYRDKRKRERAVLVLST